MSHALIAVLKKWNESERQKEAEKVDEEDMNKEEVIGSENRALIIWMQNNILDRLSETAMCVRWWCARIEH